jgi:hypothetical protein
MLAKDIPFVGGFNKYSGLDFDQEDAINIYPVYDESGKGSRAFFGCPGLRQEVVVQPGHAAGRALFVVKDLMYGVFGNRVYFFRKNLVPVFIGKIGTSFGYVSIADNNGGQVIFVDGQGVYVYTVTTGVFAKVISTGVPPLPLNVAFLDTYFAIPVGESQTYQISANNDGTKWNDFFDEAQVQTYPGINVGVGVVNERLFFFKNTSTEIWYNAGLSSFPFRKDTNLNFNFGCNSTASISSDYGYLFWHSQDKSGPASIMMSQGNTPEIISNQAVEDLISKFTNPTDVQCYIYKDQSHIFYVSSWTTDDVTLVYDVRTKQWHRMAMVGKSTNPADPFATKTRHLSSCHAYFNNTHYVGSYKNSILYSMSRSYPDNAGDPIVRERKTRPFYLSGYTQAQINKIQTDVQPGVGDVTGIYTNPGAYLSLSKDGGHTFGNEQESIIGQIGHRKTRVLWRKKGLARNLTMYLKIYASVAPIVIMGCAIDVDDLQK